MPLRGYGGLEALGVCAARRYAAFTCASGGRWLDSLD